MKYIVILLLLLILPITSAYVCQDETDMKYIPCEVITPITTCSTNANVSDLSNNSISTMVTMNVKDGLIYNFSFPYNYYSEFSIILCSNSTATMTIGNFATDYNDKWLWFYIFTLGIGIMLFIFGFNKEDNILTLLSGFLFLAFGITFITVGYPDLTNATLKNSITLVTLGIGMYITSMSSLELVKGE